MAIDLSGTPPFSFTYVRKSVSGVELDSHTVTSIPTKHYEIPLSQEGTFHLTGVSDAYCKVPRGVKRRSQHHIEKLE
jgi:nucleoporin POM152